MLYISSGDGGKSVGEGPDAERPPWSDSPHRRARRDAVRHPARQPVRRQPLGRAPEIWSYGLRNVWKFSFDGSTNKMWFADVGRSDLGGSEHRQPGRQLRLERDGGLLVASPFPTPAPTCDHDTSYATPRAVYNHSGNGCADRRRICVSRCGDARARRLLRLRRLVLRPGLGAWTRRTTRARRFCSPIRICTSYPLARRRTASCLCCNYSRVPGVTPPPGEMPGGIYELVRKP